MKLYFSPGACSLADHIALIEAGLKFDREKVDLKTKKTEHGDDFTRINPKGYVPALTLDSGETVTENIAILDWIAHQSEALKPQGPMGHTHLLEALAYVSTEIHKSFKPFFSGADDAEKAKARDMIGKRFDYLAGTMQGDYLLGDRVSTADCYLFVMLMWARKNGVSIPQPLAAFEKRMGERDAVKTALAQEGLN